MGMRDLIRTASSPAILAVTAPKNTAEEQALGNQRCTALGLPLRGRWSERQPKLLGSMVPFGVQWLIVDDAQDLSLEHLMSMKELTDQGRWHYGYPLGWCLVTAGRGNTIPRKAILDPPDVMWRPCRRRLDQLAPFGRVAGHPSDEVREILAALETVYRELLPQRNWRQWGGSIYTGLTQPVLDPTSSGRVTMDARMQLVTTALAWSYQAGDTAVRAETLEAAASLLVRRRDTRRIIDGAGPSIAVPHAEPPGQAHASGTEASQVSSPHTQTEKPTSALTEQVDQALSAHNEPATRRKTVRDQQQPAKPTTCTFSGGVPMALSRFLDSGIARVECPDCASTRTLAPRRGVLRCKSHDKRKTRTPTTARRWTRMDAVWDIVGGERLSGGYLASNGPSHMRIPLGMPHTGMECGGGEHGRLGRLCCSSGSPGWLWSGCAQRHLGVRRRLATHGRQSQAGAPLPASHGDRCHRACDLHRGHICRPGAARPWKAAHSKLFSALASERQACFFDESPRQEVY